MKKFLSSLLVIFCFLLAGVLVLAASVTPVSIMGNDIPQKDLITPDGCVFYSFEDNSEPGTYTVSFNCEGEVDTEGPLTFGITIGTQEGNEFTEVLSWESNFPVYAVTVMGGGNFNLYVYDTAMGDTKLVAPDTPSGKPADVSHTSLIFCPPFCPSPTPTATPTATPKPTDTPTPKPPKPTPIPPDKKCDICICLLCVLLSIISFVLGILVCVLLKCCEKKAPHIKCKIGRNE